MRTILATMLLLTSLTIPATVYGQATGQQMKTFCQKDELYCVLYAVGFVEGRFYALNALNPATKPFCIPTGVSNSQLAAVYIKHLNDNPNELHLPSGATFFKAIKQAFPCTVKRYE